MISSSTASFNGATFFQTWKSGEATGATPAPMLASMEPRFFKRGNEKAAQLERENEQLASMEPRFFKRGNGFEVFLMSKKHKSFNGATFFQTWKSTANRPDLSPLRRASMEPRFFKRGNLQFVAQVPIVKLRLQWSHVFSNVEMRSRRQFGVWQYLLQWSHVFSNVEIIELRIAMSYNTSLQWSHVFSNVEMFTLPPTSRRLTTASMEPRFFKRGNTINLLFLSQRWLLLQWSHVFSNVEMSYCDFSVRTLNGCFNGATFFQTWKYF